MGAQQYTSVSRLQQTKNVWFLLTTLSISLILFFATAAYHVSNLHHTQKSHAAAAISEITALVESHKSHLSTRDVETAELEARSIGSFFSGLASSIGSGVESAAESAASDLGLGNITSLISTVTGLFSGNGSLIDNVVGELATPAKFLGMGLAMGGLTGLNFTTSMNTTASGVDKVAMNLGSGLTSTIFSSSNVTSIFSKSSSSSGIKSAVQDSTSTESDGGLLGGSTGTLGQAVLALSQGLGSGTVQGLKLNTDSTGSMFNTTGLNGIAGNFGQGLTSAILGGLNISLPSLSLSSLMTSVTKRDGDLEIRSDDTDFFAIIRREFDTLDSQKKRGLSSGLVSTISDLALGLGSGLGQGTAVGLGFQNTSALDTATSGIAGITQNFASGLTSSFLTNGTLTKVIKSLSSKSTSSKSTASNSTTASSNTTTTSSSSSSSNLLSGLGGNVDIAKVLEGLAVGLVSGAGSQVSSLQLIAANTTSFDDTVDGAAIGFGRGLGSEAAKLVSSLISNGLPSSLSSLRKRSADAAVVHLAGESSSARLRGRGNIVARVIKRASTTTTAVETNATDIASVIASLNASSINPLLQTGVDSLTCSGVGGLFGIFLGLVDSKTINLKSSKKSKSNTTTTTTTNITSTISVILPDELFIIHNAGNIYSVNPSQGLNGASVNGFTIVQILILGGIHIIFAIGAWFIAIPLLLLFYSTQKLALFFQPPSKTSTAPLHSSKTQKYLFWTAILLSLIGFVFGVVIVGTGQHMRGAHPILALLLLVSTIISGIAHVNLNPSLLSFSETSTPKSKPPPPKNLVLAYRSLIGLLFIIAMATLLTGFGDMTTLSLCIVQELITVTGFVAIGMLVMTPLALSLSIYALKTWVFSRIPQQSPPSAPSSPSPQKFASIASSHSFSYQGQGMIELAEKNGEVEYKSRFVEVEHEHDGDVENEERDKYKNTIRAEIRDGKMVEKSFMKL